MPETLLVHGYTVTQNGSEVTLGPVAQAVCDKVAEIQDGYDDIVLLGGFDHLTLRGCIDDAMMAELAKRGVPRLKMIALATGLGQDLCPPRDTAEEVAMVDKAIDMDVLSRARPVDVILAAPWLSRARAVYRHLGISVGQFVQVEVSLPMSLRISLFIAGILAGFDPLGSGPFGKKFRDNRRKRTYHCQKPTYLLP